MIPVLVPLLLEAALRALLAAFTVWAGLRLLRISNVLVQKAAWCLVLVAALAMPLTPRLQWLPSYAAVRLPALPWSLLPDSRPAAAPALALPATPLSDASTLPRATPAAADRYPASSISTSDVNQSAYAASDPAPRQPAAVEPNAPQRNSRSYSLAALGWLLYLGVSAALLLRLLYGLASALSLWLSAAPVSAKSNFDLAAGMALRSSPRVVSPVTIGSAVLLPADFVTWDANKLRIVLAHELSHIRQGDFYLQILAGLYTALFWFSPLGWWLKRKLCELGEAISDRAGLEEAASRSSYAQLLLEFAALPRPTLIGVAMARTSHLSDRIERLLNEASFRQAFAASRRRALLAVLLVPVSLFAATTLIRVEAAGSPTPAAQAQPAAQDSLTGQSTIQQITDQAPPPAPAQPAIPAPAGTPDSAAEPAPPAPPAFAGEPGPAPMPAMGAMPPVPPMPPDLVQRALDLASAYRGYSYSYSNDGDAYAIVGDPGSHVRFSGDWDGDRAADIEKARKMAHGHFLWFRHEGKSYIVDDPAIVAQIEAMNKPMEELGSQMGALARQQREFGEQQRALGRQIREATITAPDLSKDLAHLNEAMAKLQALKGTTITQEQLADVQRKVGEIQGRLGALQGKIAAQQWDLDGRMGKFGEQQGKLGGEMGKLGAEMGRMARENEGKIKGIIADSLSNSKARPIE
jgi:beta-lactamase regulating signal transducer with metallopeptidase domain